MNELDYFEGDTLVLAGEARGSSGAIPVRETITRLGPDEFRAVWEARREGGWSAYSVEHLTPRPLPSRNG